MRFPRNKQIFRGQLDIAAFTGVLFMLLIFILLHSQLVFTPGVPIRLPEAGELPGISGRTLVVAIDAGGQYDFENQITHERLLRQRLREAVEASREPITLVIEMDKNVTGGEFVKLTLIASEAGVKDAVLATRPSASKPAPLSPP